MLELAVTVMLPEAVPEPVTVSQLPPVEVEAVAVQARPEMVLVMTIGCVAVCERSCEKARLGVTVKVRDRKSVV